MSATDDETVREAKAIISELPKEAQDFVYREAAKFRKLVKANPLYVLVLALTGAEISAEGELPR